MCGRTLIGEAKAMAAKAGLTLGASEAAGRDSNRPPGTDMPVIIDARPGKLNYVKWGLISDRIASGKKTNLIYARLETLTRISPFQELVGRRHCVFVVEGFYEFDKRQTPSQPYFFERRDQGIMLLAGLWDVWKDDKSGVVIPSATMIMQPANRLLGKIHDRMPCLLTQSEADVWLNRELGLNTRIEVLHPVAEDLLHGWQVDKKVNYARNKDLDNNERRGSQLDFWN